MVNKHLCECGCGETTPLADRNRYARGQIKGQPLRFMPGHSTQRRPLEERFWRKVEKRDGCWFWTGASDGSGYGKINRGATGEGNIKAHRLSYEIHFGAIDDDLFVCHRCDNPHCVNPAHLFLGTPKDNTDDMLAKQRPHGRPFALDHEEVIAFVRAGNSYRATALHFGVPTSTVWRYLKREQARTEAS